MAQAWSEACWRSSGLCSTFSSAPMVISLPFDADVGGSSFGEKGFQREALRRRNGIMRASQAILQIKAKRVGNLPFCPSIQCPSSAALKGNFVFRPFLICFLFFFISFLFVLKPMNPRLLIWDAFSLLFYFFFLLSISSLSYFFSFHFLTFSFPFFSSFIFLSN